MAKFREGDRVKHSTKGAGTVLYIAHTGNIGVEYDNWNKGHDLYAYPESQCKVMKKDSCYFEVPTSIELITDYQPITPKAGERYRVLKQCPQSNQRRLGKVFTISEIDRTDTPVMDTERNWYKKEWFTTEYLELVEEPSNKATPYPSMVDAIKAGGIIWLSDDSTVVELNKQPNLKTKMTNFIKKLTQSADDKTLEKAGFMDSCGELTGTGSDALESLIFAEKKADLVKLANEMIAEREATK